MLDRLMRVIIIMAFTYYAPLMLMKWPAYREFAYVKDELNWGNWFMSFLFCIIILMATFLLVALGIALYRYVRYGDEQIVKPPQNQNLNIQQGNPQREIVWINQYQWKFKDTL